MSNPLQNRRNLVLLGVLLVLAGGGVAAYFLWPRPSALPAPGSPVYDEYLRAFQVGTAALDAGREEIARPKLTRAVELIPGEPAGWANLGLLSLRKNELAEAARDLKRASTLAPDSGEIEALLGLLARKQGRLAEAVAHFRKAVEKDPHDLPSLYVLAEAVSEEGGADSQAEYQRLLGKILEIQPRNLMILSKRAGVAFERKDRAAFEDTLKQMERLAPDWTPQARDALKDLLKAVKQEPGEVAPLLVQLENLLRGVRGYSRDAAAVSPQPNRVGAPVQHFLRLQPPRPTPAPPDRELTFKVEPVPGPKGRWDVAVPVWLLSEKQRTDIPRTGQQERLKEAAAALTPAVFVANAREVRRADGPALTFPGGAKETAPSAAGVLALDWDNDYRTDLLLAGAGGLRFYQQQPDGTFQDVTAKTGLPADVLGGDYYGAWAADIEMDGDLDIIVARRSGPALLLLNNRDGTFKALDTFAAVKDVRAFAWADLDNDGAPDAAFLDAAGKLHVFANDRLGHFSPWPLPGDLGRFLALTAADMNNDGVFDLVALRADGALVRLSDRQKRKAWDVAELARGPEPADVAPGSVSLFVADMDNNGALDVVIAGPKAAQIFLADPGGELERRAPAVPLRLAATVPLRASAVIDLDHDGRLDLLGVSGEGQAVRALNRGKKNYRWQVLWPSGNPRPGDERINSFGIGGEIEVRSGPLVQKQLIHGPAVHFGLGEQKSVDVARIVWPNGVPQWEWELPADRVIAAEQRLSGSCPFLFTYDGTGMRFAGDFMWGTPLGMYVNGQNVGDFPQTTEWLKIPGEHLVPRDGHYDVRVQANLWEADYFDQLALLVVDHPPGTEIHVDERFFLTPTPPRLYVTTPARPVARAWDHFGSDATDEVRAIDGHYLDRAGRGRFQGITRDHWVEADLGDDAPREGPVYLIARGWLHPTNSSINVAISQGKLETPRPLVLEVPDGKGGWKAVGPPLGFPAGKNKTMLIRLDGIDGKGVSRRFRLRTNLEIYWDFLGYAKGLDEKLAQVRRPEMLAADLRYLGFLEMTQKDASSPEIPRYDKVTRGGQPWRDLTGYYTRFGDVRELLAKADDRYVIANAGDEIALRFAVPQGPPAGWKRDFIWECDGWTRDGDLNTRYGNTVLPLPAHDLPTDDRPPTGLQDDPVYQWFPQDWQRYHTRYVTDDEFARGLRNFRPPHPKR
jgi:tetratricopeptide (TPR) repeat protein